MREGSVAGRANHSRGCGLTPAGRICGIDFDNTLVTYDEVLAKIAHEKGLVDFQLGESKRKIRDRIRRLPNGEIEWQRCQALLYGPRISEAKLIEGVPHFFELCRQHSVKVYVVSHKTEFSRFDNTGTNLRTAALAWMASNAFFEPDGLGLTEGSIFFADSRQEKINRISALQCTDFVDDLEETFLEVTFPRSTGRILYEPGRETAAPAGVLLMKTWQEISDYFFHSN